MATTYKTCLACGTLNKAHWTICKKCNRSLAAVTAYPAGETQQARAPRGDAVCTVCGFHGPADLPTKGGCAVELVLWLLLIVPGIIYSVWRRTSLAPVCRRCGSPIIVSDRTPEGQRILARVAAEAEDAPAAPAQAAPPASVADELERLARLRDSGALSPEEFDAAKRKLLDR